jgi:hypothetical protein
MQSTWKTETGQLACRWSVAGHRIEYNPPWMQSALEIPSGYLEPVPDFASRSPFGGVSWFQPKPDRDPE